MSLTIREDLIGGIATFLAGHDLLPPAEIRAALEVEIDRAGPDALVTLKERLTLDMGWAYYPPDPLARRIHHVLADRFVHTDSIVEGLHHLAAVHKVPLVIVANHVSYADANLVEVLLDRAGVPAVADRLTAVAGPKVFSNRQRRFSSLCFGTIKVPQSADVSSEEAMLGPREVARAARMAIDIAHQRLLAGDVLLLFAEGTRSRSGGMQPMLPAVARYLEARGAWVVPAGLTGSDALFPLGDATIHPSRAALRFGPPVRAAALFAGADGDRRLVMDAVGLAVARQLPDAYRGVYGTAERHSEAARLLEDAALA